MAFVVLLFLALFVGVFGHAFFVKHGQGFAALVSGLMRRFSTPYNALVTFALSVVFLLSVRNTLPAALGGAFVVVGVSCVLGHLKRAVLALWDASGLRFPAFRASAEEASTGGTLDSVPDVLPAPSSRRSRAGQAHLQKYAEQASRDVDHEHGYFDPLPVDLDQEDWDPYEEEDRHPCVQVESGAKK